ncbi:MAG: hypothetical protein F6K47_42835, partial [Symploca sp. SIO2E6]|nr:hypothetical protein [Symploca sp. SIO2E6]
MGEQSATGAAFRLATLLKPRCLAMVGICAGRRGEVNLGDVLVAESVFKLGSGMVRRYYKEEYPHEETFEEIKTYNLSARWLGKIRNSEQNLSDWTNSIWLKRPKSYEYQKHWLLHKIYEHQENPEANPHPKNHPNKSTECQKYGDVIEWLWDEGLLVKSDFNLKLTPEGE